MKKETVAGTAAALGMLVLILDSKTALLSAAEGVELCIKTVIPSLFPFILLSNQIVAGFSRGHGKWLRPLGRLFSIPRGAEAILIPAFLGGYPIGAQCIGREYKEGHISREAAQRMLGYCSNTGPAFLFGIARSHFTAGRAVWALWGIQILSALLVSGNAREHESSASRAKEGQMPTMAGAVGAMASICGWIVMFRVMIGFLDRWFLWRLPAQAQTAVMGLLELSNGCCALGEISDERVRFVVCAGMLSFGGVCVLLQTGSVICDLSIGPYLIGKLKQSIWSTVLAMGMLWNAWATAVLILGYFLIYRRKVRKNSSNPMALGV